MNLATSPPRRLTACLLAGALLVSGCSKGADTAATAAAAPTAETLAPPPPPEDPPPPPTQQATAWTPAALDELLAPIALYPDPILAQVLAASTNAQEVLDAGNWLLQNPTLKDEALTKAAADAGFSPSVQALVHFPTVVDMMCRELDWTKQLGDAFSADQPAVLDAVQRLRKQAKDAGNLVSSPQMKVETTDAQGKEVIVVQPADPKVIYVPQYNPTTVYVPAPSTTTVVQQPSSGITTEQAVVGGLLAFTAGVLVANAFNDNHNNNYCYPNWGYGGVYYGARPYYPHNTFIYAPHYSGYRPSYGYRPPANYPAHYNNYQNNYQRNSNNNVTINNNNNYFNKFDKNQNRVPNYQPNSPVARPATGTPTQRPQGSTGYAGATQRPGNAAVNPAQTTRPSTGQPLPSTGQPRPTGQYAGSSRPAPTQAGGTTRPAPAGASQRPSTGSYGQRPADQSQRPSTASQGQRPAQGVVPDRGYPKTSGQRRDATASTQRGGEFHGAGNEQASRDRAASQRGKSSMSSAPRPSSQQHSSKSSGNKSGSQRSRSGGGRS